MEHTPLGRDEILALPLLRKYDFRVALPRVTQGTIYTVADEQIASHAWGVGELHLWPYLNQAFARSPQHALGEIHDTLEHDFHDGKKKHLWMTLRPFVDVSIETKGHPCFLVRTLVKAYPEGLVSVPELFVNNPHYQADLLFSPGSFYANARIHLMQESVGTVQRRRRNVIKMPGMGRFPLNL